MKSDFKRLQSLAAGFAGSAGTVSLSQADYQLLRKHAPARQRKALADLDAGGKSVIVPAELLQASCAVSESPHAPAAPDQTVDPPAPQQPAADTTKKPGKPTK